MPGTTEKRRPFSHQRRLRGIVDAVQLFAGDSRDGALPGFIPVERVTGERMRDLRMDGSIGWTHEDLFLGRSRSGQVEITFYELLVVGTNAVGIGIRLRQPRQRVVKI